MVQQAYKYSASQILSSSKNDVIFVIKKKKTTRPQHTNTPRVIKTCNDEVAFDTDVNRVRVTNNRFPIAQVKKVAGIYL